jgi:hypothetical protein
MPFHCFRNKTFYSWNFSWWKTMETLMPDTDNVSSNDLTNISENSWPRRSQNISYLSFLSLGSTYQNRKHIAERCSRFMPEGASASKFKLSFCEWIPYGSGKNTAPQTSLSMPTPTYKAQFRWSKGLGLYVTRNSLIQLLHEFAYMYVVLKSVNWMCKMYELVQIQINSNRSILTFYWFRQLKAGVGIGIADQEISHLHYPAFLIASTLQSHWISK